MTPPGIETLVRDLPPDALVLDLGCGTGLHARVVALAGRRVVAVDVDFDAVFTGRQFSGADASRPAYAVARAEALPFPDGLFDAVLCIDVLHWARDEDVFGSMWRNAWQALAPDGILLARVPLADLLPDAAPLEKGRHRLASGAEWFLPSIRRVREMLSGKGGEVEIVPHGSEGSAFVRTRKVR